MRSINFYISLFLLGAIGLSSCKKDQPNEGEPYSSITNLSTIAVNNSNIYYYEPVKLLSLEDGYLMLNNIYYNNSDVGIQYNKLNANQELVWSETYSETGYQNKGVDLIEIEGNIFIAINFGLSVGGSTRIKLLRLDQSGTITKQINYPDEVTSHSHAVTALADGGEDIHSGNTTILLTGQTGFVDVTKPGYVANLEQDLEDIFTVKLDLDFVIKWDATYGFVKDDKGSKIMNFEDGFVVVGTTINREPATDYHKYIILLKYRKESGNIINTQQYTLENSDLELIDMVYDTDRQQFHLFAYNPNATSAVIYKISTDHDFSQIGDIDEINLVHTEATFYRSVNLLSNGLFLATIEKPTNEDTQNLEWITFDINGMIQNRYTFNDPELKYTEGIGSLRDESANTLSTDHLVFPVAYQNKKEIGIYSLDLNIPTQN